MDSVKPPALPDQRSRFIDTIIAAARDATDVGELYIRLDQGRTAFMAPQLTDKLKVSLVEALPNVIPVFGPEWIKYIESTFKELNIEVLTKAIVKEVEDNTVVFKNDKG